MHLKSRGLSFHGRCPVLLYTVQFLFLCILACMQPTAQLDISEKKGMALCYASTLMTPDSGGPEMTSKSQNTQSG